MKRWTDLSPGSIFRPPARPLCGRELRPPMDQRARADARTNLVRAMGVVAVGDGQRSCHE